MCVCVCRRHDRRSYIRTFEIELRYVEERSRKQTGLTDRLAVIDYTPPPTTTAGPERVRRFRKRSPERDACRISSPDDDNNRIEPMLVYWVRTGSAVDRRVVAVQHSQVVGTNAAQAGRKTGRRRRRCAVLECVRGAVQRAHVCSRLSPAAAAAAVNGDRRQQQQTDCD